MTALRPFLVLALAATVACGSNDGGPPINDTTPPPPPGVAAIAFDTVALGLDRPLYITAAPGDATRLFIVEQDGRIRIVKAGVLLATPFLAIEDSVSDGNEQGLLGLAFAPDYASSGAFYIHTTDNAGGIRIYRFKVSGNADVANAASGQIILAFAHPDDNHNGGMLAFGSDGFLYVGSGDGGGVGDPGETGQDPSDLLGAILRIDVSGDSAGYVVPGSNPFVGDSGYAPELWAYGFRNPWRFSFDRLTHELWIGDVGQGAWEEVDRLPAGVGGQNLGWDEMEGTHCFEPATGCDQTGKTMPLFEYARDINYGTGVGRCSVTGGYVYRGSAIPSFVGKYFYGDFCDARVRAYGTGTLPASAVAGGGILTFGEDAAGELYVGLNNGVVARIVAASP